MKLQIKEGADFPYMEEIGTENFINIKDISDLELLGRIVEYINVQDELIQQFKKTYDMLINVWPARKAASELNYLSLDNDALLKKLIK